ncbi:D-aminoacyl-tRNA deacylase [Candidatus Albibeggiatoa sp. nov. NOAA]|uniref:D-aminoacyl-tRNA deacylase n=1 Tax=Candidatus Albibeggiatoa sp. nov. NOAA TaxID=3162724 RepID=UPI0032F49FC7|nr:D-aminoacyl-tRNA deacylase [Thiotrichaceae bacterium]
MIALLQRVTQAQVEVDNQIVGQIKQGLMVLLGVEKADTQQQADRLLQRVLTYRVFSDAQDKMNLSLKDIQGGLLLVPQFTLPADTRKGTRPSFTPAAPPEQGLDLFNYFCDQAKQQHSIVETGQFGADMQVSLTNDGPVTFWLQVTA